MYCPNKLRTRLDYLINKIQKIYSSIGTTGAILLGAFFVDVIVWYKAGSIKFVDEQVPFEEELHTITGKIKTEGE